MMQDRKDSIFHRTPEGTRARHSRLPEKHRAVLQSVGDVTHFDAIAARLGEQPSDEILRCLDDLEAIGLIESIPLEWLVELYTLELCEVEPMARPHDIAA